MDTAASMLGISRLRAVIYINETLDVLNSLASRYIVVVGAVDGTLIRIPRPRDFEGWDCRKNFPAVNVQAIVYNKGYFRSIYIRAGSNNDQSLWNGSGVKKR
ncbi:hypothetical protein JG687_00019714 [Phytophthora cactorum]|uniref:DDE Tnp4 domain-containing protein n=1 Tax=Phytophthora cactorum TaxID=29920 RepID=A0A8T1TLG2_9STRA|nr:hypothetical protein JG687_00019714 [Phytophthora cactorum]